MNALLAAAMQTAVDEDALAIDRQLCARILAPHLIFFTNPSMLLVVVEIFRSGGATICNLMNLTGMTQQTISYYLGFLLENQIIICEKLNSGVSKRGGRPRKIFRPNREFGAALSNFVHSVVNNG